MLGHEIKEDELDDVLDEFDEDHSGEIEFGEFIKLAEHFVEPEQPYEVMKQELRDVFMIYDKEGIYHMRLTKSKSRFIENDFLQ